MISMRHIFPCCSSNTLFPLVMDVVLVWLCYIWLSLLWCCIKCNQIYGINYLPLKNRSGSWVSIKKQWHENTYFSYFSKSTLSANERQILFESSILWGILMFLYCYIIRSWRFTKPVYPLCPHTLLGCPLVLGAETKPLRNCDSVFPGYSQLLVYMHISPLLCLCLLGCWAFCLWSHLFVMQWGAGFG